MMAIVRFQLMNEVMWTLLATGAIACATTQAAESRHTDTPPFVVVLGIAQDGGYPQSGCAKDCCESAWNEASKSRNVACLAIVDPATGQRWMIDATPDFRRQLRMLDEIAPRSNSSNVLDGILLTHAHIGHYTGLMHLGHEAMGAKKVAVHAMPRMREFLSTNGPWDQLVRYENIALRELAADTPVSLNERITITPFRVPHREEYSEAVGFRIDGPSRSALYIPDIDKWDRWDRNIDDLIKDVDVAFLDGTFYDANELPHRDMSEIPHPFIVESMKQFESLSDVDKSKVRFIHLNHTNPAMREGSKQRTLIEQAGFGVASERERHDL